MPDATWKDNAIQQIRGWPTDDEDFKESMLRIVQRFSESDCKELAYSGNSRGRFFYDYSGKEFEKKKLRQKIIENGIFSQREANAEARAYYGLKAKDKETALNMYLNGVEAAELDNPVFNDVFQTSYRQGGHLYLYGVRIY